jgi:TonB family protein
MIIESEYACDDYVLIAGRQARTYAEHLLHSAHRISRLPREIAASSTYNSELEGRIMSILANRKRAVSARGIVNIGIIAIMCLLILPLAGMSMMSADDQALDHKSEQQMQEDEAKKAEKEKQIQIQEQKKKEEALKAGKKEQYEIQLQEKKQKEEALKAEQEQQYKLQMQEQKQKEEALKADLKKKEMAKKAAMNEPNHELKQHPEIIYQEQPAYPESLKEKNIEGSVVINAFVTKTGEVKKVKVEKSSGHKLMDQAALDAAYKCKYKPAIADDGNPVGTWIQYKVSFNL